MSCVNKFNNYNHKGIGVCMTTIIDSKPVDILISSEQISKRIAELGADIDVDIPDGDLVVIGVLKGSFMFMADLIRAIKRPLSCDFMRVSSYKNDRSTGSVRMEFDLTQSIEGKHVLLIEDIVDSGRTLRYLLNYLENKQAKSLNVVSLLYKEMHTDSRKLIDYLGFEVPDRFVIGYGLDTNGLYRSLPYVGAFA